MSESHVEFLQRTIIEKSQELAKAYNTIDSLSEKSRAVVEEADKDEIPRALWAKIDALSKELKK